MFIIRETYNKLVLQYVVVTEVVSEGDLDGSAKPWRAFCPFLQKHEEDFVFVYEITKWILSMSTKTQDWLCPCLRKYEMDFVCVYENTKWILSVSAKVRSRICPCLRKHEVDFVRVCENRILIMSWVRYLSKGEYVKRKFCRWFRNCVKPCHWFKFATCYYFINYHDICCSHRLVEIISFKWTKILT